MLDFRNLIYIYTQYIYNKQYIYTNELCKFKKTTDETGVLQAREQL